MNVQQFPSSSGSKFPPDVYQEFIPAAMRVNRHPRPFRPQYSPGPPRPPRFYYSRPLAPQYMVPRPRFGVPRPRVPRPGFVPDTMDYASYGYQKNIDNNALKDCICERPEMAIICQRCGSELFGRIQRQCSAHPNKIQLMDHSQCPNKFCRSIQLVEVSTTNDEKSV